MHQPQLPHNALRFSATQASEGCGLSRRVKLKLATVSQDDNGFYAGFPTTTIKSSPQSISADIESYAIISQKSRNTGFCHKTHNHAFHSRPRAERLRLLHNCGLRRRSSDRILRRTCAANTHFKCHRKGCTNVWHLYFSLPKLKFPSISPCGTQC